MDPQFQELSEQITKELAAAVTTLRGHMSDVVSEAVTAAEHRLSDQARINAESVKESARTVAEAYGATLEAIDRRLERFERTVSEKLRDHDGVLMNHHVRITRLERRRR